VLLYVCLPSVRAIKTVLLHHGYYLPAGPVVSVLASHARKGLGFDSLWCYKETFATLNLFFQKTEPIRFIKVTVWKNERYMLYQSYFSRKLTLYAALKLLLEKYKRYTLFRSYFLIKTNALRYFKVNFQKNERYTRYQSFLSNSAQLWRLLSMYQHRASDYSVCPSTMPVTTDCTLAPCKWLLNSH